MSCDSAPPAPKTGHMATMLTIPSNCSQSTRSLSHNDGLGSGWVFSINAWPSDRHEHLERSLHDRGGAGLVSLSVSGVREGRRPGGLEDCLLEGRGAGGGVEREEGMMQCTTVKLLVEKSAWLTMPRVLRKLHHLLRVNSRRLHVQRPCLMGGRCSWWSTQTGGRSIPHMVQ